MTQPMSRKEELKEAIHIAAQKREALKPRIHRARLQVDYYADVALPKSPEMAKEREKAKNYLREAEDEYAAVDARVRSLEAELRAELVRIRDLPPEDREREAIGRLEDKRRAAAAVVADLEGERDAINVRGGNESRLADIDRRISDARRAHDVLETQIATRRAMLAPPVEPTNGGEKKRAARTAAA